MTPPPRTDVGQSQTEADQNAQELWDCERLTDPHAQEDKARRVREMFDHIAPNYQRVNTIASAGRDRRWREHTVRLADVRPTDRVLDIACGTGDLAATFAAAGPAQVVGVDFAMQMLQHAAHSLPGPAGWCLGDALQLPFPEHCFDITSCAFGVRNFQDLRHGFAEMYRVLRPGGRAMILEFSMPGSPLLRKAYGFYFCRIMPRLATWLSGDRTGAYRYLPQSVLSFASPATIKDLLLDVGFDAVEVSRRTLGVVLIFKARKQLSRAHDDNNLSGDPPT